VEEGWFADDNRPVLAVPVPLAGVNDAIATLRIGAFDYGSGLAADSLEVRASIAIDGIAAGQNLAGQFTASKDHRWEWELKEALAGVAEATFEVSVKDKAGNITEVRRRFSVR